MFKLKINGVVIEFQSNEEMVQAYKAAMAAGDSVFSVDPETEGPQTQAEAAQGEVVEEGFSQDFQQAAPSANVEPASIAQEDTGLPQADTSSDLPIKGKTKDGQLLTRQELFFKNRAKPSRYADAFIDPDFDLAGIEEKAAKEKKQKEQDEKDAVAAAQKQRQIDFGIINSDGEEVKGAKENIQSYTDFTQGLIDQGILNTFQADKKYLDGKVLGGAGQELKDYVKSQYAINYTSPDAIRLSLDAEGNPIEEQPINGNLPTQYAQDSIIEELVQSARRKENKARADMQKREGTIIALDPSEEIENKKKENINNYTTAQQELISINQQLRDVQKTINAGVVGTLEDARVKKGNLLVRREQVKKGLSKERDLSDDLGLFIGIPTYLSWFDKDYEQMFDLEGNRLNPTEVATMPQDQMMAASPQTKAQAEELATADFRTVQARYYYNLQEQIDLDEKLQKTYSFDTKDNDALFIRLKRKGYTPDKETGIFTGVKVKDLISMRNQEIGENILTGAEGRNMLAAGWIPQEGDLVSPNIFMQGITEDRVRISEQGDALSRMYLLNIDPASEELNITDGLAQFAKVAAVGVADMVLSDDASSDFKDMLPATQREQLDFSYNLMEDADIEMTDEQKENFERGVAMQVTEGLGAFVPMAINFALVNKIGAVAKAAKVVGTLIQGTPAQKALGIVLGMGLEEFKFELATIGEAKTGGGGGFFAGGQIANRLLKGRFGGLIQKMIGGSGGFTLGSEGALVAEAMADEFMKEKDWKTSMEEYYGDLGEVGNRLLTNAIMGGLLPIPNAKELDFVRRAEKVKMRNKLNMEREELLTPGEYEQFSSKESTNRRRQELDLEPLADIRSLKTKELDATKRKRVEQIDRQLKLLTQDLYVSNSQFNNLDIGAQSQQANFARTKIAAIDKQLNSPMGDLAFSKNTTKAQLWMERGVFTQIIKAYEANKAAAKKDIIKETKAKLKAAGKENTEIIINETGEGLSSRNAKAQFQPGVVSFGNRGGVDRVVINLSQYQRGVAAQETLHAWMDNLFKNKEVVAKEFRDLIESDVEGSFKNIKFVSTVKKSREGGRDRNGDPIMANVSFKEIIKELYGDQEVTSEEYLANITEFLSNKDYANLLLDTGVVPKIARSLRIMSDQLGVPIAQKHNLTNAREVMTFLHRFGEVRTEAGARKLYEALSNMSINGERLIDIDGTAVKTMKEQLKEPTAMSSMEFKDQGKLKEEETVKKSIESAKKLFNDSFKDVENLNNKEVLDKALLVSYTLRPWVVSEVNKVVNGNGNLTLSLSEKEAIVDKMVTDFTTKGDGINENVYGGQGLIGSLNTFIKTTKLIKYIEKNNPTPEQIDAKAAELLVIDSSKKQAVAMATGKKEKANFMTYLTKNIKNKILGEITGKDAKYIFETQSSDASFDQIKDLTNEDGINEGNAKKSPIDDVQVKSKKRTLDAFKVMRIPGPMAIEITNTANKILLTNRLENIDISSKGTIELADGVVVDYVMPDYTSAVITYPDGTVKNVSKFRGPGKLAKKLGAVGKVKKEKNVADVLVTEATDLIYNKLESVAGKLTKDNRGYTAEYEQFVMDAFKLWENGYITLSQANKRFASFTEFAIGADGKFIKKSTDSKNLAGGKLRQKRKIAPAEWRGYFLSKTQRIDGRRRSLLEALSGEFGSDAIEAAMADTAMRARVEDRQAEIGVKLVDGYARQLGKLIDRGDMSSYILQEFKSYVENQNDKWDTWMRSYQNLTEEQKNDALWKSENLPHYDAFNEIIRLGLQEQIEDINTQLVKPELMEFTDRRTGEIFEKLVNTSEAKVESRYFDRATSEGMSQKDAIDIIEFKQSLNINSRSTEAEKDAAKKSLKIFDFAVKKTIENLPPKLAELVEGAFYNKSSVGNFLAGLFRYNGRIMGGSKRFKSSNFRRSYLQKSNRILGSEYGLSDGLKADFETVLKELKENNIIKEEFNKNSKRAVGINVAKRIQLFETSMLNLDLQNLSVAEKQTIAKKMLKDQPEIVRDIVLKRKLASVLLRAIGEVGNKLEGQEKYEYDLGISHILRNNDSNGFRMMSFEGTFQFSEGPRKVKEGKKAKQGNEHSNTKLLFSVDVQKALKDGTLSDKAVVKQILEGYNSVIMSPQGMKIADFKTGAGLTDAAVAKMILSVEINKNLTVPQITYLRNFLDIVTQKTAYDNLIDNVAKDALDGLLTAPKEGLEYNFKNLKQFGFGDKTSTATQVRYSKTIDLAFEKGRDPNKKPKGISVFDFDDTLAKTKSNVLYTMPDGSKGKLNATEFAKKSEVLSAKGAIFDFREFSQVMKGELGPLFSEAKKKEGKYTNKDVFILTARPADAAPAIMEFLRSEGLEIPIENIVGLGDGSASAKAEWMVGKVAEGYNDFYFADDAIKNVEAVKQALSVFDVKSDVQQAIMSSKKITLANRLAEMIERKKGISAKQPLSAAKASNLGKKKGRFDWFMPPNAEDFAGLMYKFYGKGAQGNEDMALIKETLIRPFNRAENAISTYKQTLGADYEALEKKIGDLKTKITPETKAKLEQYNFNADQATRVFIYNKLGYKIPGIEEAEINNLVKLVKNDPRLSAYADGIMGITKTKELFPRPSETWFSSNIRYELFKYATEGVRGHFLKDWQKNIDEMFTEENFNRIEAGYGKNYANNLKEMLARMKTGKTRSADLGKDVQAGMDYVNGSVGVIMFLNTRSAVLQTISAVNYVNWSDNNPLQIGKAVAKPKEWGKTFLEIYNSDFLKQRRGGLEINVEEAEIAKAVERSKGNARNLYDNMIKIGFKPTQMADSFAIAFGGTPFLMNRTATYVKQGLSAEAARKRAFEDFREVSEESQQSSRQDRVSNIQTGVAGRLIFAFANTPMQMTRMTKKAALDLANGRGDAKTNISKMIYYGAVQSYIFYALQQSQFLRLFGGDDEDMTQEEKDFNKAKNAKKNTRIANSMFDSFISGSGSPGKVAITAKNTILKYYQEKEKGYKADYGDVLNEALSMSPPLSSKTKKIYSAYKSYKHFSTKKGQQELAEYGQYAFDNPMLMANAKVFSSVSNVPVDRLIQKVNNLYSAFTDETLTPIQSAALAAGWDKWSLGLYDPDFMTADEIAENKIKRKEQLKKEKAEKKKAIIESFDMDMGDAEKREVLKVLTKKQQIDSLKKLGVRQIKLKSLMKLKEIDRIEEIIKLQNKRQFNQDMQNITTNRRDSLK